MITDERIAEIADALGSIGGVRAVALGGSRARGTHQPPSDVDLGVYYVRSDLDLDGLRWLAARLGSPDVDVAGPGEWGPWVDGGAWLTIDDTAVDWILRDVDRVGAQCERARSGEFTFHTQQGHPLGFLDISYAGEVALGLPLSDDHGILSLFRTRVATYPDTLRRSLIDNLWQARFLVDIARKGAVKDDIAYVSLCCSSAAMMCAHAWHAAARQWVTNEKDLVPNVGRLPIDTRGFAEGACDALAEIGAGESELGAAIDRMQALVDATDGALG